MTPTQIQLVKKSWRLLRLIPPEMVADTFYSKLFYDHPELRRMFPKEMNEQYTKLIDMLSSIISRLEDLESYQKEIEGLARRHVGYGVQPKHYAIVGEALLWTLEKGLGNDWDQETAEAWGMCYQIVADQMQNIQ